MQSTAYLDPAEGIEGLIDGSIHLIDSRVATATLHFGAPAYYGTGDGGLVAPVLNDTATLTLSAVLVTGNVVAGSIANGASSGNTFSVPFTTDSPTTITALGAALALISGVQVVSVNTSTRVIVIRTPDSDVTSAVTIAVTGGASQATVSQTNSSSQRLVGVVVRSALPYTSRNGTLANPAPDGGFAYYNAGDSVNIMRMGTIWVPVGVAVNADEPVYRTSADAWTNVASGNTLTPYYFRSTTTGAGLAKMEVTLPVGVTTV